MNGLLTLILHAPEVDDGCCLSCTQLTKIISSSVNSRFRCSRPTKSSGISFPSFQLYGPSSKKRRTKNRKTKTNRKETLEEDCSSRGGILPFRFQVHNRKFLSHPPSCRFCCLRTAISPSRDIRSSLHDVGG